MSDVRSRPGDPIADDFQSSTGTPIFAKTTAGFEQLYIVNESGEVVSVSAINGVQSALGVNSTATLLGSGATFTGTYEQNALPDVCVSCISEGVGGTLYFDFSPDGTNTNTFPVAGFPVSSGVHEFHTAIKAGRYFRARFVSDAGTQTAFRLYTYYGLFRQPNSPLNTVLAQDSDAITTRAVDSMLDISADRFGGFYPVTKFGRAPDGVQTTSTDIWDRADSTPTQQIWLAPTAARVHAIVSSSTDDDGSPAGSGARTIRVSGLTSWATAETSEDVTMNGTTPVNTANSYVIIHRMRVLTNGASGPNVGTITATAATDSTVTAVIRPTLGTTEMAIYGWPSTQKLYITYIAASMMKASGTSADVRFSLLFNFQPDVITTTYNVVDAPLGLTSAGASTGVIPYVPYLVLEGPGILKINAISSASDIDATARFSAILADN